MDGVINPKKLQFQGILNTENLMLSKRYESTEVDRRTWLHVPSESPWSTSGDTHQIVQFWFINSVITKYREINNISFSIYAILLSYKSSSHAGLDRVNTRVPTLGVYARL